MAASPAFAGTPRLGIAQVSAANTARDGTGTIVAVLVGAADGTKVFEVVIEGTVSTTTGMVRLFIDNGTNVRMFDEVPVLAATVSATTPAFRRNKFYDNFVLPSASYTLYASTHNAEAINVFAHAADF